MDFLLNFIKATKKKSKVLFGLWILFSIAGAGNIPTNYLYTVPVMAIIFLLPAIIIEYKNNPVVIKCLVHWRDKRTRGVLGYINSIQRNTIILFFLWILFSIAGAGDNSTNYLYTVPAMAIIFLLPAIIIKYGKHPAFEKYRRQKIVINNQDKNDDYAKAGIFKENNTVASNKERYEHTFEHICNEELRQYIDNEDQYEDSVALELLSEQMDISSIDGMDGHEFEYFCAELLRKNEFVEVSVTQGSGDQGVDILAQKDGIKYAIQCKNYASKLSNTPVQEVNAGKTFYKCHVGVVMTNSTFSIGAATLAEATNVLLWDRNIVQKMMEK